MLANSQTFEPFSTDDQLNTLIDGIYEQVSNKSGFVKRLSKHPSVLAAVPAARHPMNERHANSESYEDGWSDSFRTYGPKIVVYRVYLARGNGSVAFMVRGDGLDDFRKSVESELETVNKPLSAKSATSQLRTKIAKVVKYARAIEAAARKRIVSISNALNAAPPGTPQGTSISTRKQCERYLELHLGRFPDMGSVTKEAFSEWIKAEHDSRPESRDLNLDFTVKDMIGKSETIHLNEVRDLERFLKRPEVTEGVFHDACAGVLLDLILAV